MPWIEVRNYGENGLSKFETTDPEHEIPFDKYAFWKDKYGNVEKARLKLDAFDHFFPHTE